VLVGNIFEVKADTILIGMLVNMLVLFGFHYIFTDFIVLGLDK
jgi:hypothetical protein